MKSATQKVAIVLYRYPLGVSTMIISTAVLLARMGWGVDLFVDAATLESSGMDFNEDNIRIYGFEDKDLRNSCPRHPEPTPASFKKRVLARAPLLHKCLGLLKRHSLTRIKETREKKNLPLSMLESLHIQEAARAFCRFYSEGLVNFSQWIAEKGICHYDCIIGVEHKSIIAAISATKDYYAGKVLYYNMELKQDLPPMPHKSRIMRLLEKKALERVDYVVIQDEKRADAFVRANTFDPDRLRILPVAAIGQSFREKGNYFRNKFNIDSQKIVVLYAGNFTKWSMCLEIINSSRTWPDCCVLIMHTWVKNIEKYDYYREMKREASGNSGRVFFSTDPVPYSELPRVLSSADIGLAFYAGDEENFTEIGFSSNKIAQYLQAGLPIISNDLPSLKRAIEGEGCGICVSSVKEIGSAIVAIGNEMQKFRDKAFATYERHYNMEHIFGAFWNGLWSEQSQQS